MGLTTALYTGRTGLTANSTMLSVTGNNIANVNTTAFKASRAEFETLISQTLSSGSPPTGDRGGSNPAQVGLGVRLANSRDFSNGALQPTGQSTDMAIEGNGFFVVNAGGEMRYTRAGNFTLDRDFNLVNPNGALVQGYGVDDNFNIQEGELGNVNIPIGAMTLAEATKTARFSGNLNAGGDVATQGAIINTQTIFADATATTFADDTTALNQLFDADGNAMFADGDLIQFTGVSKGGKTMPDRTFEVGNNGQHNADATGQSLGDLMTFIQSVLGIDTDVSGGVSITDGVLSIEGNGGTANDLDFEPAGFIVNAGTPGANAPLTFNKAQAADGESTRTTFVAYDSLGNEMTIDVTMVLEEKNNGGTEWRYYAQSSDHTDLDRNIGSGIMNFNTKGRLQDVSNNNILIGRDGTGAGTPQQIELLFNGGSESISALADKGSQLSPIAQDGSPLGTLADFSLGNDGTIQGVFSNGLMRDLGRLPVAMFVNNEGLEEAGGNLFKQTANSGQASLVNAGTGGAGRTIGAALEQSNVDLADEFINLISATTGFSASSRVLTTSDRLLQELMTIVR
ncbi:flagellar hook protein FlgE [Phycisphaerales bacterium AB-hyl4]|uniref:Flagellar hook protein FlgE n=1 Tax=Natronomicrosphaera hydrolytica TaxID=3242702 RepID=A0ABV4U4X6_9BACT